jgi:hypothetical protein
MTLPSGTINGIGQLGMNIPRKYRYSTCEIRWLSKLHALTTGRLCLQNSLVTAHSFRPTYAVAKWTLWTVIAELWVLWTGVLACVTDRQYLGDQPFIETGRKEHGAIGKASKLALHLRYSCSYQVSGIQFVRNSRQRKMIETHFIGLLCIFQIYVDETIETTQMICLHIARQKSDRRYLGCVDIRQI